MLLILAGVSISLVVGDNGVLTQAKGSSDASKLGQMKEAMGLAIEDCQTAYFNEYTTNASVKVEEYITPAKISDALKKQGYDLYKEAALTNSYSGDTAKFSSSADTKVYVSGSGTAKGDYVAVNVKLTTVGAKAGYGTKLNEDSAAATN